MYGRTIMAAAATAAAVLFSACSQRFPNTDRPDFAINVTNIYPYPLSVIVKHNGGTTLLGVVPAGESREFHLRMWQSQSVSVVAAPLDNFLVLRQSVYLDQNCIGRVVFQDVRIGTPVAGPVESRDSANETPKNGTTQPALPPAKGCAAS